jgi:hypothetical protein
MLSRLMGTSVEMISQNCGHVVPDSEGYLRGVLHNLDTRSATKQEVMLHSLRERRMRGLSPSGAVSPQKVTTVPTAGWTNASGSARASW